MKEISPKCLARYGGHDWVTVYRGDPHGASESWMECHECGMTISEIDDQEMVCMHKMRCFKCGYPMLKEFRAKSKDSYVEEEELDKAINNTTGYQSLEIDNYSLLEKAPKPWFINSKGDIQRTGHPESAKHQKRMAWGNCFATREEAEINRRHLEDVLKKCRYNCTNEIAFGGCPIHTPGACMPPKEIKLPEKIDLNIIEDNSRVADLLLAQKINEIIDYLS
jgi:hypothetical protein